MSNPTTAQELRALLDKNKILLPQDKFEILLNTAVEAHSFLEDWPGGRDRFLVSTAARMVVPPSMLTLIHDGGVNVRRVEFGDGTSETQVIVEGIGYRDQAAVTPERLRALARAANAAADIMAAVRGEV